MNAAQEAIALLKDRSFNGMTNAEIERACSIGNGTLAKFENSGRIKWETIENIANGAGMIPYLIFRKGPTPAKKERKKVKVSKSV